MERFPEARPVLRPTPLPRAPARGLLIVTKAVADRTRAALRAFSGADGRHEGIVLWAGHRCGDLTVACSSVVPDAEHSRGRVYMDRAAVGRAARAARRAGLVLVSQVHSHPGSDTRHSDGDDRMILLPFEGMFSVVVAGYGDGSLHPRKGAGLHQFQDGRWVLVEDAGGAFLVVPAVLHL